MDHQRTPVRRCQSALGRNHEVVPPSVKAPAVGMRTYQHFLFRALAFPEYFDCSPLLSSGGQSSEASLRAYWNE